MLQIRFRAMGCAIQAILDADSPAVARSLEMVPIWFEEWEQALSRFRPDSELNQLNRSADRITPVSRALWEVLDAAFQAFKESSGLVTPALLDALILAGYDRSFDQLALNGPAVSPSPGLPLFSLEDIERDPRTQSVRLPAGLRLDFGGVAKGWATHQAADRLAQLAPALVSAGGDISVSGSRSDGNPWPVGVEDPRVTGGQIELLALHAGGVATSGKDYRRWLQDGIWKHHILDPRTGRPSASDVLSATVIAPTLPEAEMAAKTVFILGSAEGLRWLEERPALDGLLVLEDGSLRHSTRWSRYIWGQSGISPTGFSGSVAPSKA